MSVAIEVLLRKIIGLSGADVVRPVSIDSGAFVKWQRHQKTHHHKK